MSKLRSVPVAHLQQQEVGDFADARAARLRQPRGQCLATLVQQADDLAQKTIGDRVFRHMQQRWQVLGVEQEATIGAALDDARNAQAAVAIVGITLQHQAQVEAADLQWRLAQADGVAVGNFHLGGMETCRHGGRNLFDIALRDAGPAQRDGQHDTLVTHIARDVDCQRRGIIHRQGKRRAVPEYATGLAQGKLALVQGSLIKR
jgi:hypothetical protein